MDARKFGRLNFSPRTWRLFPNFVTPLQLRSNSKFSKLSPFLLSNNPLETRSSHPLCCNSTSLNFQFYFLRIREQALSILSIESKEGRKGLNGKVIGASEIFRKYERVATRVFSLSVIRGVLSLSLFVPFFFFPLLFFLFAP